MTTHALRTSLALLLAPWLMPKEQQREWKIASASIESHAPTLRWSEAIERRR